VSRDLYAHRPHGPDRGSARVSRRALFGLRMSDSSRVAVDYTRVTESLRSVWDRGTHATLLRAIEPVAEVVAGLAEVGSGTRVLDVAAGDGNVALACAGRGATVSACDLAPAMAARGRARCGEGIDWAVADALDLPHDDGSFDAVVSAFGATLAPHPARMVSELVRVARPGGIIVLAAWTPRGLPGRLDELTEEIEPLPHGVPSPARWGVEAVARRRLQPVLEDLELRARSVPLRFASPGAAFDALAGTTPLDPGQLTELRPPFERLLASCNESGTAVEIRARYLIARGHVRDAADDR
jgi:ubiquinone/menaquinone biosynthesis C-methylase UbiE